MGKCKALTLNKKPCKEIVFNKGDFCFYHQKMKEGFIDLLDKKAKTSDVFGEVTLHVKYPLNIKPIKSKGNGKKVPRFPYDFDPFQ